MPMDVRHLPCKHIMCNQTWSLREGAWEPGRKKDKCMKFRLIALLAVTLVYMWRKLAYPLVLAAAIQYLEDA